jgi:O-antigen/teichoic acid export membrane protein
MALTVIAAAAICALAGLRTVWGLVGCAVAASAVGLAGRLLAVRRLTGLRAGRAELRFGRSRLRPIVSFGIRSSPMNYTESAARYADTAVLAANVPLDSLGAYNRAYGIYTRFGTIPLSLSRLFFPTQSALFMSGDRATMARVYRMTVRYLAFILLPAAAWVAVSAPAIMALFGPGFVPGATALSILIWTVVIDAYGRSSGGLLSAADRPGRVSLAAGLGAVVNVSLCFALIPRFGLTGAAVANFCGWAFTALAFGTMASRLLGKPLFYMYEPRYLCRLALGCALFALLLAPLRETDAALLALALAAPPALAVSLLVTRPLDRADDDLVRRALISAGFRSERLLAVAARAYRLVSHDAGRPLAPSSSTG